MIFLGHETLYWCTVQTSVATQANSSTATQADSVIATQKVVAVTLVEGADVELPPVPPSKVSKTGASNGREKFVVLESFWKNKGRKGCH